MIVLITNEAREDLDRIAGYIAQDYEDILFPGD